MLPPAHLEEVHHVLQARGRGGRQGRQGEWVQGGKASGCGGALAARGPHSSHLRPFCRLHTWKLPNTATFLPRSTSRSAGLSVSTTGGRAAAEPRPPPATGERGDITCASAGTEVMAAAAAGEARRRAPAEGARPGCGGCGHVMGAQEAPRMKRERPTDATRRSPAGGGPASCRVAPMLTDPHSMLTGSAMRISLLPCYMKALQGTAAFTQGCETRDLILQGAADAAGRPRRPHHSRPPPPPVPPAACCSPACCP